MSIRPPPRSFRRQRLVVTLVAVALVGVGVGVPLAQHLGQSPVTAGPPRPKSFQILYTFVTNGGAGANQWELLTVQRPFDSSDLYYAQRPQTGTTAAGVAPGSGTVFTSDLLYSIDQNGPHAVSGRQPGPSGSDQDLLTQLPELLSRNEVSDTGQSRSVLGRTCEVWSFSGPPSGPIMPLKPPDHDDLCIDSQGLVLTESWTYHGKVVEQRQAQQVVVGAVTSPVSPEQLDAGGSNDSLLGRGVPVAHAEPDATTFIHDPPTPPGFTLSAKEGFVEPDPQNSQSLLADSLVWAFADGADVITVEAGQSGQTPWAQDHVATTNVKLTHLGSAQSEILSQGVELHVAFSDGRWVRIRGTVALDGLERYADSVLGPTS